MGPVGIPEMFGIVVVALLLFGPKKLPELGRLLGRGLTEFRRVKSELKSTFDTHMRELEREAQVAEQADRERKAVAARPVGASIQPGLAPAPVEASVHYPYPYEDSVQSIVPEQQIPASSFHTQPVELQASQAPVMLPRQAEAAPVAGVIARSNGVHPTSSTPVHGDAFGHVPFAEEERPA